MYSTHRGKGAEHSGQDRGSGNTSKVQIPAVLLPSCVTSPPLLNLSRPVSTFVERRHSQDLPHGVVQGIKQNNHGMCFAHIKCCCHFTEVRKHINVAIINVLKFLKQ